MIQSNMSGNCGRQVRTRPSDGCRRLRRLFRSVVALAALVGVVVGAIAPKAEGADADAVPALHADDLLALADRSEGFLESLPEASLLNVDEIVALEENLRFVYIAGRTDRLLRRIVLLKPGTLVIDDRTTVSAPGKAARWTLLAQGEPRIDGKSVIIRLGERELHIETILPDDAPRPVARSADASDEDSQHAVEVTATAKDREARFLHVLEIRRPDDNGPPPSCRLTRDKSGPHLTVTTADETLRLSLPDDRGDAGKIAVTSASGRTAVEERLLPAGSMPHGEEGVRLVERWDTPYQGDRRPGWDTGRVAPELKRLVEEEGAKPGRAVVLGCGMGTNAIYLASKGFEVIGIDVAPTALARAEEKAREAGVDVRWMVADVLAIPELAPVDFIFDRGCYHHVRQYNAPGYVENVRRLSHSDTRLLLLAGSANDQRRGGPPKIKEEEIRSDFSDLFEFQWFREIRFDSRNPGGQGSLAWSVLMRRKGNP